MTRKQTIIVAVLLNMTLLTVLFMTTAKEEEVYQEPKAVAEETTSRPYQEDPAIARRKAAMAQARASLLQGANTTSAASLAQEHKQETKTALSKPSITHKLPPVQETPPSSTKEIVVKKGDRLETIAKTHGVSVREIIECNSLPDTNIWEHQRLHIPEKKQVSAVKSVEKPAEKYYTVKVGDNPWTIAMKHQMKLQDLLQLNNLDEKKARRLKPGDRLKIR